ncbi:MAG: alkaline shock response membrane anchor protein AmaP [Phascolarctobacterium sp.]|nr:alkaline shock response membrane anchor protein AmaP [Phascolarctobacterium sp.]MBR6511332.1 alkaline shock response membrane anchor protein AmaP [Phascolarctobacterium sp.]
MGIPDRIILTLYTFLMAVVAVLVTLCSLDVFPQRAITEFIASISGNWIYAIGGVIMLLVSVRLLIAGLGISSGHSLELSDGPSGKIHIGKRALEDYIAVLSQEIYGIYNVKVIAKLEDESINVRINASIEPGINIPETTGEVKNNVKESIKKMTGIEVGDIEVYFKQIKAKEE